MEMKVRRVFLFVAVGVAFGGLAVSTSASVDPTPKPGGVYRLKPGFYVQKGVNCASAPNVAVRQYDGHGISDAHTRACRARIVSGSGNRFVVEQSCVNSGAGPALRVIESPWPTR